MDELATHEIITYRRFNDRLNERETANSLSDAEYDALDAFVARLGREISLVQTFEDKPLPHETKAAVDSARAMVDEARRQTERRAFYADCFRDTLPALQAASAMLGDADMCSELQRLTKRSQQTALHLIDVLYPEQQIPKEIKISTEISSLGKWQHPIIDLLESDFPGARPTFIILPMGLPGLVVIWDGFHDIDKADRANMISDAIAKLGSDVPQISMTLALTPEEQTALGTSR